MSINRSTSSQSQPAAAIALSFDAAAQAVVIVEQADNGEFKIYRQPVSEESPIAPRAGEIRSQVRGWAAHTDKYPLPQLSAYSTDKEILESLIGEAEANDASAEVRYGFARTADQDLTLTQVQEDMVNETISLINGWLNQHWAARSRGKSQPSIRLETVSRSLVRLWFAGPVARPAEAAELTTIFLTAGEKGYAIALWSARAGLIYETEELYRSDVDDKDIIWHIFNNLHMMLSESSLSKLKLKNVSQIVLLVIPKYRAPLLAHINENETFPEIPISVPKFTGAIEGSEDVELELETALAIGSLIESELVPESDLSLDLAGQLNRVMEREHADAVAEARRRASRVALALIVPFITVASFLLASYFMRLSVIAELREQNNKGKARLAQLAREHKDFEAVKANFSVIEGLIAQITTLRAKQTGTYQLLMDLNERWPNDPTWYISEITARGPNIEIKGKTRNEQAITVFTKNLENSAGLFSNIFIVDNIGNTGTGATPKVQVTSTSVIDFTIKTLYAPLSNGAAPGAAPAQSTPAPAPATTTTIINQGGSSPPGSPPPVVLPPQPGPTLQGGKP